MEFKITLEFSGHLSVREVTLLFGVVTGIKCSLVHSYHLQEVLKILLFTTECFFMYPAGGC